MTKQRRVMDIEGMKKQIKIDQEKQQEQFNERLGSIREEGLSKQAHAQDLLSKAMAKDREERTRKRDKEIEKEQTRLKAERQEQIERETGVKSERTLKQDEALTGMLNNMREKGNM